jgi:uncharacterized damage-inducible protein DinB
LEVASNVTRNNSLRRTLSHTEGVPQERALWECLAHLPNQGTQHKTQAAAMLTNMGYSPGDIDLIVYLNQMR